MVGPVAKREAVAHLRNVLQMSERRACLLVAADRKMVRYRSRRPPITMLARVERELVLRLASLLWRLRRIISIETDLLPIQSDLVRERRAILRGPQIDLNEERTSAERSASIAEAHQEIAADETLGYDELPTSIRHLTCCFLRLSNVDNGAFERLGRYNAALWKQTAQTLFLLQSVAAL